MAFTTKRMPPHLVPGFDPSVLADGETLASSGAGSAACSSEMLAFPAVKWPRRSYTSAAELPWIGGGRDPAREGVRAAGALFTSFFYQ